MSSQAQGLLNQLDPPWKLRNPSAFDGHGLGMHRDAFPFQAWNHELCLELERAFSLLKELLAC